MDKKRDKPKKWEAPMILELSALPEALGNCLAGSSETGTACANGQATPANSRHDCLSGGATQGACLSGGGGSII